MTVIAESNPPLRILLAALGGEGGGVLMNWIVAAARSAGFTVQATSVPGVAQRTGSTSYYIEVAEADGEGNPVLNLVPMPGRVDVVVASELVEAARVMDAGYVSQKLTTLISSTSRLLTIEERQQMGDGRYADIPIHEAAAGAAKDSYILDLGGLAVANGTFISATMFGALAGSGVLPWDVEFCQRVLGQGKSGEASLAGFEAARQAVEDIKSNDGVQPPEQVKTQANTNSMTQAFPEVLRTIVDHGIERCRDFQDAAHAQTYLDRVQDLASGADLSDPQILHALGESARRLALWMTYEDVARVADLKTRPERFLRIRNEAQMRPDQILRVSDFLKPRAEEIADIMPVWIGRWIMARVAKGKGLPFLNRGVHIRSNGVFGFWLLRSVANMRRIRRRSLRYHEEMAAIDVWQRDLKNSLQVSPTFSAALAELPRVLKGYSDTLQRGKSAYKKITNAIVRPSVDCATQDQDAAHLRSAISAALADDSHERLDAVLAETTKAA